jgi:hypothetical protein
MTILSRDDILAADDLKTQTVDVPEWGGSVIIRALSGEERDGFEESLTVRRPALFGPNKGQMQSVPDPSNIHAKLVARSIVGEDGKRLFTDGDVVALGAKSSAALQRCWDVAAELSGTTDDAAEAAEGNSDAVPSDGSTSASPETSE